MSRYLLKNGTVIDENAKMYRCDILVDGTSIRKIVPVLTCGEDSDDADLCDTRNIEVIDCTGRFITPGFAVLHAHSPMHILRGLAEDVNIDDWFNKDIFPYESRLESQDIYYGARLCMAEMIDNGITSFADHYFGAEEIARAAIDSGIRVDIAYTLFARKSEELTEGIEKTYGLLERYEDTPNVDIRFGPHSPYLVSPECLKIVSDEAVKAGCGIHIHASESQEQVDESIRLTGETPIKVIADAGGLDVPCILAHALYIQESDIDLLKNDTFIASSPKTYMKLGMGQGNIWKYDDRIRMHHCIGTDGAASSNTVDALEEARLYALVGKMNDNAEGFRADDIWELLMNGHNALRFDSGRIKEGCAADLNIWDLDKAATKPLYDLLAAILYSSCPSRDITDTMIGGEFRKRNGKLNEDMKSLIEYVDRCSDGILKRGKGKTDHAF